MNVILFENRNFCRCNEVTMFLTHTGLTGVFIREKFEDYRCRPRGEDRHVKMEAEIEAMLPQSREHQRIRELPEIRDKNWTFL